MERERRKKRSAVLARPIHTLGLSLVTIPGAHGVIAQHEWPETARLSTRPRSLIGFLSGLQTTWRHSRQGLAILEPNDS